MRGGCQSSLVRASDGCRYVLKMLDNPEGRDNLFHEALGSGLAQVLGLPVPTWRVLDVSESFIEQNPQVWFESEGRLTRPSPGLHFGSAFVEALPGGEIYQMVPAGWYPRLVNAGDFLGVLLLDLLANHSDNRQALFVQIPGTRQLKAVFIDHGQMFGHTDSLRMRIGRARFLDTRVYGARGSGSAFALAGADNERKRLHHFLSDRRGTDIMEAPGYSEVILDGLLEMQAGIPDDVSRLRSHLQGEDSLLTASHGDFGRLTKSDPIAGGIGPKQVCPITCLGALRSTETASRQARQLTSPSILLDDVVPPEWMGTDTNRGAIPARQSMF